MFFSKKQNIIGIDIGTSNIKLTEINFDNPSMPILTTFGIVNAPSGVFSSNLGENVQIIANLLKNLCQKAKVETNKCIISFPNSSVFTSVIELPIMNKNELDKAVEFEAKKYVPLSINDVDLSWSIIGADPLNTSESKQKVLLTAVPKQVTKYYLEIFSLANLKPIVGEIEALALIRSLIGNKLINCAIIDIGAKCTGINIVEKGLLRLSKNLNIGGETITKKIAETLNITQPRAEQFKKDFGIQKSTFLPDSIKPVLSLIKDELKQLLNILQSHSDGLDKLILAGGGANLPGIVDFFSDLGMKVEIGNPLQGVGYKEDLKEILQRNELSLPIAIGLGLRKE
jgi:type IV pilus assembly protein PilM